MDPALTSGVNVTVVGVTVVFTALTLLMLLVSLMGSALSEREAPRATDPRSDTDRAPNDTATPTAADDEVVLRDVAIAAYALHQARRVSVRGPEPASSWLSAGRQKQVGDRSRRR